MDTIDPLTLMSGCEGHIDHTHNSLPAMYQTGPFTFSDIQEMESDCTSQSTSRSHSYSIPEEGQTGQSSMPAQSEKLCPLLAGQTFQCTPELCGPNAACLDFPTVPEIEECASVPCLTQEPSTSPERSQTSQPAVVSMPDTVPLRSSTSYFRRSTRNSQQRLPRGTSDDGDAKSHSKKAHSLVERRYRENLNGNIAQLHLALLKTKRVGDAGPQDQEDDPEQRRQALSKVRKSDVMLEAVDYVHETEVELRHMANEIELLTARVKQLEKLVKCEDCMLMKQLVNFNL